MDLLGEFSRSFWEYKTDYAHREFYIGKSEDEPINDNGLYVGVAYNASGPYDLWKVGSGGSSNARVLRANQPLPLNQWALVTATQSSLGTTRLYLNDQLVAEGALNPHSLAGNELVLGRRYDNSTAFPSYSKLDDVRLYEYALPLTTIQSLAQNNTE